MNPVCEQHGIELAFPGDECGICHEESHESTQPERGSDPRASRGVEGQAGATEPARKSAA